MRKHILLLLCISFTGISEAQDTAWKIVEGRIVTAWAEEVDPAAPLPEYPRPQMERGNWLNLNGLWDYAIRPNREGIPVKFDGKILVPFAVESALSGVGRRVEKDSVLWYRKELDIPKTFRNKMILLHFGAVDWLCDVYVNGRRVGKHQGGYDPFTCNITPYIDRRKKLEIMVRVWDPTDDGPQPRGKQVKDPQGIWHTPVTGIWQTVWMEAVPPSYVESTWHLPNPDNRAVTVRASIKNIQVGDKLRVSAWEGKYKVAQEEVAGNEVILHIPQPRLWSPTDPFLYDLKIELIRRNKVVDQVKSYFAMRKIAVVPDAKGIQRITLNGQFLFQNGLLDQGWWPDGLYTAPSDSALKLDIQRVREMGFNMIRKQVKVEPARWYYHCDKLGMLVWQDMPCGDLGGNRWDARPGIVGVATEKERSPESESIYINEWKAIVNALFNFPSIVVWIPFNEGWGQFKTTEVVNWITGYDPLRLVNAASGGNFTSAGHILDIHNYPDPVIPDAQLFGTRQVIVLGEYGGLGLPLEGHTWQMKDLWAHQHVKSKEALLKQYESFVQRLTDLISMGLSAAVYSQATDVEGEVTGLMTYDRKVIKVPIQRLYDIHQRLYDPSLVPFK